MTHTAFLRAEEIASIVSQWILAPVLLVVQQGGEASRFSVENNLTVRLDS